MLGGQLPGDWVSHTSLCTTLTCHLPTLHAAHTLQLPSCSRKHLHSVARNLPGAHWLPLLCVQGFFVPYLTGGVVLVVLAVGSTAPGLLQFFTDKFQTVFPDYRERVLKHEAGHFLVLARGCGTCCMVCTMSGCA